MIIGKETEYIYTRFKKICIFLGFTEVFREMKKNIMFPDTISACYRQFYTIRYCIQKTSDETHFLDTLQDSVNK